MKIYLVIFCCVLLIGCSKEVVTGYETESVFIPDDDQSVIQKLLDLDIEMKKKRI